MFKKVNTDEVEELSWSSPKGTMRGYGRQISEALGRQPKSTDLMLRHPFDVEILRIPAGFAPYPHHSHSAQWEFYHVISGSGFVRHEGGKEPVRAGDAMLFKPGEAHQFIAGDEELVVYVIADNPIGESYYYPDSEKVGVNLPERRLYRGDSLDYFDGEE